MAESPDKLTTQFVTADMLAELLTNPNIIVADVTSNTDTVESMFVVKHRPRKITINANRFDRFEFYKYTKLHI